MIKVTRALHRRRQQFRHLRPQCTDVDQLVQVERLLGEFTDRYQRAVDRHRAYRDVDAGAVEQAGVAHRMRFIDAPADRRDDLVDDAQQMRFVLEAHTGRLEHTAALDIDALVAVDQDVVDSFVFEQRLERTKPGHLVENFRDEVVELFRVERQPLGQDILRDKLLDVAAHLVFRQLFQRRKIDLLDQPAVQPHLGIEHLVGEQRIGRRRRGRLRRRLLRKRIPGNRLRRSALFNRRNDCRSGDAMSGETTGHTALTYDSLWSLSRAPRTD